MKKLFFVVFVFILLVSGFFLLFREELAFAMIQKLIVSDNIESADLIVALGGENNRKIKAVELFKQGYGKKILFTGFEITREDYARYGLTPNEYVYPVKSAFNTYEESQIVLEIAKKSKFKSVIVVTSFYHSRRASETFKHYFEKEGIKVMVYPVFWKNFDIKNWRKNAYLRKAVFIEWLGILFYRFEYLK